MDQSSTAAYVEFLHRAILEARMLADRGAPHAQIANLMSAIHTVPSRLLGRNDWDESLFVETLAEYDQGWAAPGKNTSLVAIFHRAKATCTPS